MLNFGSEVHQESSLRCFWTFPESVQMTHSGVSAAEFGHFGGYWLLATFGVITVVFAHWLMPGVVIPNECT